MGFLKRLRSRNAGRVARLYLFDSPHWSVRGIKEFGSFFRALPALSRAGAMLGLASVATSAEVKGFMEEHATKILIADPEGLTPEFDRGYLLPITKDLMTLLAALAERHAAPEIGMHLAVVAGQTVMLEWFDVPYDPLSVALSVEEREVRHFCAQAGASYERVSRGA